MVPSPTCWAILFHIFQNNSVVKHLWSETYPTKRVWPLVWGPTVGLAQKRLEVSRAVQYFEFEEELYLLLSSLHV